MSDEKRLVLLLLLITVAILGYLVGRGSSSSSAPEVMREAGNAETSLNYAAASAREPATGAPALPGLTIAQPLVLAPKGDAAHSGLIVGKLLGSETSPLPPKLLDGLRESPATDVVGLLDTQAYRYSQLSIAGSDRDVTLYTIPTSAKTTVAIVCYAPAGSTSELHECEQLAATLSVSTGNPQVEVRAFEALTPMAEYGHQIKAAVDRVNGLLTTVRPAIRPGISNASALTLAERLSEGLAGTAASLASLSPPPAAAGAHAALSASLNRTRSAYAALVGALSAGSTSRYDAARSRIYAAEAGLSTAVKNITLLGYQ